MEWKNPNFDSVGARARLAQVNYKPAPPILRMDTGPRHDRAASQTSQMNTSLALAVNFHNDANAMRGLLETGSSFFDNIFALDSSPDGRFSTDGSCELLESFGVKPILDDLNKGFGRIRTRLLHECGCEWCCIMDCDERFLPQVQAMTCEGTERYPAQENPKLLVTKLPDIINQGAHVKNQINNPELMALRFTRRHWCDFTMTKPAENWMTWWDHQLRCVRNHPSIHYTLSMHEALIDERTGKTPVFLEQDPIGGPHVEHMHVFFRRAYPGTKQFNEENYARLSRGEPMITR